MTTKIIEGVVVKDNTKTFTKKDGSTGQRFALLVNTGNGEEWFNFGFVKPTAPVGALVKFNMTQNGQYWNADSSSVEIVRANTQPPPAVSQAMTKAVASVDNRQRSIVIQTAYKVAPEIILGALEHGLVTLPAKKADKFDAYISMIDEVAFRLASTFIAPPEDFAAPSVVAKDVTEPQVIDDEYGIV